MDESTPSPASPRPRLRVPVIVVSAVTGVALFAVTGLIVANRLAAAEPAAPQGQPIVELIEETLPPGLETIAPDDIEVLGDPIGEDVMQWQNALQTAFHGDPNFGSPAISQDGTLFTIVWYGEPTDALQAHVSAAPSGLDVEIQSADFPPGELQRLVAQAMEPGLVPGVEIALGAVENDASGIRFGLAKEPAGTLEEIGAAIADALGRPDVPIRVDVSGTVIPING